MSVWANWCDAPKGLAREDSQLATRLNTYNPQAEVVILCQVEDRSQFLAAAEMYRQIYKLEILIFCDFEPSIQGCYERFSDRTSLRLLY